MTTLPALSTPCTWNTFLARSTPMVLTCMWTTPSGDSLFNDHPLAHSMPGAGVVHPIIRIDIAMSALSSAFHNTGHYHVRPRPVCLSPSCETAAPRARSSQSYVVRHWSRWDDPQFPYAG